MKIVVIIVTYNGLKWLPKCLGSLREMTMKVDVVIVDNNSSDGTVAYIKENHPDFRVIEPLANLGFGRANNIGLKLALEEKADYVFLLNQDAWLQPETLEHLVGLQRAQPVFGIVSPVQLNGKGTAPDQNFASVISGYNIPVGNPAQPSSEPALYPVHFVMAAMWLISAGCLRKVGLFDGIFNHYGEDNDYINRARYHGFKIGVATACFGFHDREFRQVSAVKKLGVLYAGLLAFLTDLNTSFFKAWLSVGYLVFKMLVKAIIRLDLTLLKAHVAQLRVLVGKTKGIRDSRAKNASPFVVAS